MYTLKSYLATPQCHQLEVMWILLLLEYFYRNDLKDFAFVNYTGVCIIFNFTDSLEKAFGPHINSLRKRGWDPSDDRKADGSLPPRSPAPRSPAHAATPTLTSSDCLSG